MKSLLLLVTYTAKPGMRAEFLREIRESGVLETIRREEGCLAYDYFLAAEDGDRVLLVERWTSREAQRAHMAQPHMKTLMAIKDRWIAHTGAEAIDLGGED